MNRLGALTLALVIAAPGAAAWLSSSSIPAEFRITPVRPGSDVYTVFGGGPGTNSLVLIHDAGILLIDAKGSAETGRALHDALRTRWPGKPLRDVILTHMHPDVVTGLAALRKAAAEDSAAGDSAAPAGRQGSQLRALAHDNTGNRLRDLGIRPEACPENTFSSRQTMRFGGETITVHYKGAAHTDGDVIVHFAKAKVLAVGGLVANRIHPAYLPTDGADLRRWIRVLETLARDFGNDEDLIVVPGDGQPGPVSLLTDQATYLRTITDFVDQAHARGLSRAEFEKESAPLRARFAARYAGNHDHLERTLRTAFNTLR